LIAEATLRFIFAITIIRMGRFASFGAATAGAIICEVGTLQVAKEPMKLATKFAVVKTWEEGDEI
jgi:hypothetical protein